MDYIATFFTHSGAVKYKKYMTKLGINVELLPVPRRRQLRLRDRCQVFDRPGYKGLISEDIDKLFAVEKDGERLLYSSENG